MAFALQARLEVRMSDANPVAKWVVSILGSVAAALLVWWLTHSGGPLNPLPPTPTASAPLSIVAVQITDARVPESATAQVSIYNNGTSASEDCKVWWYSGSDVAAELASNHEPSTSAVSEVFGLRPAETRVVTITSLPYTAPGSFDSRIQVCCLGVNVCSERLARRVRVLAAK
jgi:hypothetical protein